MESTACNTSHCYLAASSITVSQVLFLTMLVCWQTFCFVNLENKSQALFFIANNKVMLMAAIYKGFDLVDIVQVQKRV